MVLSPDKLDKSMKSVTKIEGSKNENKITSARPNKIIKIPTKASKEKDVTKIFLLNRVSATVIIPAAMARRAGLNNPTHVSIEEVEEGILIKKLDF